MLLKKLKYIITITVLVIFSNGLLAKDCGKFSESFNHRYKLSLLSNDSILIKDSIDTKKDAVKVSISGVFNGPLDRHSQTEYQLVLIQKNRVEITYDYSSDTRSMGGNYQSCKGTITIDL